jgi:hypothetical protein
MKNVYHYTKGYCIGQILLAKQIEPMTKGELPGDNLVWLTREETYPRTALPAIPELPETLMMNQLQQRQPVDLLKVAEMVGGVWRFVFNAGRHPQIKSWYGSYQRNKYVKTPFGQVAERLARQVGDQVDYWAVAQGPLSIVGARLQQLTPQGWVDRVSLFKQQGELMVEEIDGVNTTKLINDSIRMRRVLFG